MKGDEDNPAHYHALWHNGHFYGFKRFVYDYNNRFVIMVGTHSLVIGNLEKPKDDPFFFNILVDFYEAILDVSMISESTEKYTCLCACKVAGRNQIHIFDIVEYLKGGEFWAESDHLDGNQ